MKHYLIVLFVFILMIPRQTFAQTKTADTVKRYIKVPAGYLMVLRQGDDVLQQIEELVKKEKIPSANYTGMGFVNAKFGFFNFQTKEYEPKEFNKVEMASMSGAVAWQDGKVSLHTHGVVTDRTFAAFGGHLLSATVDTGSLEVLVTLHDVKLERKMEQPLGANVLQLKN
ncbi:PPC domain-containing DNA-binding protein [Pedobacter mucosus]|uniref:PPC domain-containing DNA-binding protein n=1 Tax=Pedobacter mucosus TaxID=2895286 RepID=UPI001EE3D555|nr:PPC domain-containing DNA-binding protein [Pedobacter mucosus]UKT64272.1 DNA-binding protein [Pedobacter mucosus]